MSDSQWHNARIRDASVGIALGTKVLVKRSSEKHTSIGTCWWVYDGKVLRQVAESFGGKNLSKCVIRSKVFSEQERMDARFDRLVTKYRSQRRKTTEKRLKSKQKAAI